MGRPAPTGLVEANPPRRAPSGPPRYSSERIGAINRQLRKGTWLTDGKAYNTRSKAYHQADTLYRYLHSEESPLERKTWGSGSSFRWAIRRAPRKE